jgi:hypothetical protein
MLHTISQASVFENRPLVQILHCPLLRKTLFLEIVQEIIL